MGFIGDIGHFIMVPLYYIISAVLLGWHKLFTVLGLDADGGLSWALSIIGLTLVIRAALIPLFVKQIKSSRNMQLLQPKVKELQKKYGHDRNKLAEETMKLYREAGTNVRVLPADPAADADLLRPLPAALAGGQERQGARLPDQGEGAPVR